MNTPLARIVVAVLLSSLLGACGHDDSPPPPSKPPPQGRAETRNIRNLDTIGVSGNAIGNKVDSALTATEEQHRKMEEAERQQAGGDP